MRTILIACESQETAERCIRVAADLSVVCGANLSIACVKPPAAIAASAGLDAVGHLSSVLFTPADRYSPIRRFTPNGPSRWLDSMGDRVSECWSAGSANELAAEVMVREPDLVITCDRDLARLLVAHTSVPVWRIRSRQREQSWFLLRKLRCAVRGPQASAWAARFGTLLGVEVETMPARRLAPGDADLVVIARNEAAPFLSARFAPPVVVV